MSGIYTASKRKHAHHWIRARAFGYPICSTWIDEAGEGETDSIAELWFRCISEASDCDALVLYRKDSDEELKGALVEVGAALGRDKPVFAVGFNGDTDQKRFSFLNHPLVELCENTGVALDRAGAYVKYKGEF